MKTLARCFLSVLVALLATLYQPRALRAQDAGPCSAAKNISKVPVVITKPGTYVLHSDLVLTDPTAAAITVAASDVIIDLAGHSLTSGGPADDSNTSKGVVVTSHQFNNVVVRNGSLRGFLVGVSFASTAPGSFVVDRVEILGSGAVGILLQGDILEVRGCRVVDTGHVSAAVSNLNFGIYVGGRSAVISDNSVVNMPMSDNQLTTGIRADCTLGSTILRNEVYDSVTGQTGILAQEGLANFVVGNHVSGWGICFNFGNTASKYQDNLTLNCNTPFSGGTSVGTNN